MTSKRRKGRNAKKKAREERARTEAEGVVRALEGAAWVGGYATEPAAVRKMRGKLSQDALRLWEELRLDAIRPARLEVELDFLGPEDHALLAEMYRRMLPLIQKARARRASKVEGQKRAKREARREKRIAAPYGKKSLSMGEIAELAGQGDRAAAEMLMDVAHLFSGDDGDEG